MAGDMHLIGLTFTAGASSNNRKKVHVYIPREFPPELICFVEKLKGERKHCRICRSRLAHHSCIGETFLIVESAPIAREALVHFTHSDALATLLAFSR